MKNLIYVFSQDLAEKLESAGYQKIESSSTEGQPIWIFAAKANSAELLTSYSDGEDFVFSDRMTF